MTDDLPEWLRALANRAPLITHERERLEEAAALIESLREERLRMRKVLGPDRCLMFDHGEALRTARDLVKPAEAEGKSDPQSL